MKEKQHTLVSDDGTGIVTAEQADSLISQGWAAADLHVHTMYSYDVIPTCRVDPEALYRQARRRGFRFIAFTDHDTMEAYDRIGWDRDGLVPAVEVKILDRERIGHTIHINIYTLTRSQFKEIEKISQQGQNIELLVDYLKDQKLPYIYNHPFWHEPVETPHLPAIIDAAHLFPVLEYNMGRVRRINEQALFLAEKMRKGIVATTDSHIGDIGRAVTLAKGYTFREFFQHICQRKSMIVPVDMTLGRLQEETVVRIRHLFDKKAWLFHKEWFRMDTGNSLLDGLITRMAHSRPERYVLLKKMVRNMLEIISHSGIPGSLYIKSQHQLADRIGHLLREHTISA